MTNDRSPPRRGPAPRRSRTAARALAAVLLAACEGAAPLGTDPPGEPPGADLPPLVVPVDGTIGNDVLITYFLDHDPGPGLRDHRCGTRTYDGHLGVDLVLPNFAAMDRGVAVRAALPGLVISTHDGEPDRNTEWAARPANQVTLRHVGGYATRYLHLMRGSVRVAPGDSVRAGDLLGQVGSSGMSDIPHLHFELIRNGRALDPFDGPCWRSGVRWSAPLEAGGEFRVLDRGVAAGVMTAARIREPPARLALALSGDTISAWVQLLHVRPGSLSSFELFSPSGERVRTLVRPHTGGAPLTWLWAELVLPHAGTWRVEYHHEGSLRATMDIPVHEPPADGWRSTAPRLHAGLGGARLARGPR